MAVQTMPKQPLLAADTNVLIDLAARADTVLDCFSTIHKRLPNSPIIVLPTVITELAAIATEGETARAKNLAAKALQNMRQPWGFQPMNYVPVGHGIVEETVRKIRSAGLLPEEEVHDSFIIAEAALANIAILLSSDRHLTDIEPIALKRILDACDLAGTVIVSPRKIVNSFFGRVH
jgi:hypothetical protein